ncbi:MAG: manganese-binding transcriptional regulator MntR [Planctomycetota bacterium]
MEAHRTSSHDSEEGARGAAGDVEAGSDPPTPGGGAAVDRIRAGHSAVRRANRIETAEDYVEAIDDLVRERGEARVKDLARCFGVSHVTVSRTVERLQREGLAVTAPYRAIELSEEGRALAARSRDRHAVVLRFLLALGIPSSVATSDAEGLEHHVGDETLAALERHLESSAHRLEEDLLTGESARSTGPERFARVRAAHAAELTEDYVEAIGDLIEERGEARVVSLSRRFGVSHVTVSRMVGRLKRDGYVDTEPYRPIVLTEAGRALASASRERHRVVLEFLLALGVPPKAAEIDAEGVEHHVSPETLRVFEAFRG